jgi:[CysO sulfur-carrier protein]-S-L-cysteine hydrolase
VIELADGFYQEILEQAARELPNEACGLIAALDGAPARIYAMRNADESPVTYRLDAKEQLRVENDMEREGLDLFAIYHSHTHTEAYPSPTDRARAHWEDPATGERVAIFPGVRYLILSLEERDQPVLRAFRFEDGEPVEEDVKIT